MRGAVVLLVLLGILAAGLDVHAADRRSDRSRLVVMTFNAEFLWDGRAPEEGQVNFPWKNSPDQADERMRAIAGIIAAHDPDIVNLVEVEGLAALEHLNSTFLADEGYGAFLAKGRTHSPGRMWGSSRGSIPKAG